jgi:hypothetical protein
MRLAVAPMLLALAVAGCGSPMPQSYENPPLAAKIDRMRIERDNCLLARAPQLDDRSSDVRGVARRVAASCADETDKLLALTVPYPDTKARDGFQQEAERRAAYIVLTFRRMETRPAGRGTGEPTPLSQ